MTASNGYVDLQINGYAGVDFNSDDLTDEQFHDVCERLRNDGVDSILATVITDDLDRMCARLTRIANAREGDDVVRDMIRGVHIEGPFINERPGYVGAHPRDAVFPAEVDAAMRLLEAAGGLTRLFTLAPECDDDMAVTRRLVRESVRVAAGHSNASVDELRAALDSGLSMYTHLGNGCPMQQHRHDNIVQRVLSVSDRLWISFIADGAHVPWPALGNYLKLAGVERSVIVTDAISAAGLGPGSYTLGDRIVNIGPDLVPRSEDGTHFVGSGATMKRMAENLEHRLDLSPGAVDRLTRTNPRQVLDDAVSVPG